MTTTSKLDEMTRDLKVAAAAFSKTSESFRDFSAKMKRKAGERKSPGEVQKRSPRKGFSHEAEAFLQFRE
jgi:hypothetical protein